jgi:integrase/recombinase XerD
MTIAELKRSMEGYLAVRDALGFTNRAEKILLPQFVKFVDEHGVSGPIRAELALQWACASGSQGGPSGQAGRLRVVRGFLAHLRATVPETHLLQLSSLAFCESRFWSGFLGHKRVRNSKM